jgi:hypothetical protein
VAPIFVVQATRSNYTRSTMTTKSPANSSGSMKMPGHRLGDRAQLTYVPFMPVKTDEMLRKNLSFFESN